jgi:hypothetical protein
LDGWRNIYLYNSKSIYETSFKVGLRGNLKDKFQFDMSGGFVIQNTNAVVTIGEGERSQPMIPPLSDEELLKKFTNTKKRTRQTTPHVQLKLYYRLKEKNRE